jgi:hypothetical protein
VTNFSATLVNQTDSVWTLAVFITIPNAAGMLSVAWQVSPAVAPTGNDGVTWNDGANVCIGTSTTTSGVQVFKQNLSQPAAADQWWAVTSNSGALTLTLTQNAPTPGQIQVTNSSTQVTNVALGYSGSAAVYAPNLLINAATGFIPIPQYWALITQSVPKPGQVVAYATTPSPSQPARRTANVQQGTGQFLPPKALNFPANQTAATVTLKLDGSSLNASIVYAPLT